MGRTRRRKVKNGIAKCDVGHNNPSATSIRPTSEVREELVQKRSIWHFLQGAWKAVAAAALILAIIGSPSILDYYLPHITVVAGPILDQSKPFAAPFLITNNGHFAIRSVKPCLMFDHVVTGTQLSPQLGGITGNNHSVCMTTDFIKILRAGDTDTVPFTTLVFVNGAFLVHADFRVMVRYRYFFIIPHTSYYRYSTFTGKDGVMHMYQELQ